MYYDDKIDACVSRTPCSEDKHLQICRRRTEFYSNERILIAK